MAEPELGRILKCIDDALEVYRNHHGTLRAQEVSVKSMLAVLQKQVEEQLIIEHDSRKA